MTARGRIKVVDMAAADARIDVCVANKDLSAADPWSTGDGFGQSRQKTPCPTLFAPVRRLTTS